MLKEGLKLFQTVLKASWLVLPSLFVLVGRKLELDKVTFW